MKLLRVLELVLAVGGMLAMGGGYYLSYDALTYSGLLLIGIAICLFGFEGILRRRVILLSRYSRRADETYQGIAGVVYGLFIMLWGAALTLVAGLLFIKDGRELFLDFVRRPGLGLLFLGMVAMLSAAIAILGSVEEKQGSGFEKTLNLLASRLLPGFILIILSLAFTALGLIDIVAPQAFDKMGGGFIEVLFGLGPK